MLDKMAEWIGKDKEEEGEEEEGSAEACAEYLI